MTYRSIAALIAVGMLTPAIAAAQSTTAGPPLTAWGDPDLGGVWDFRTITPLERPADMGDKEFLSEEEVAAREKEAVERAIRQNNAPARRAEAGDNVGAYNRFWMDFGTEVVETRRTSLIVDPPNGRRPPMTPEAKEAASKRPRWGQEPPPTPIPISVSSTDALAPWRCPFIRSRTTTTSRCFRHPTTWRCGSK